jgi:hypothetical protein
MAEGGAMVGRMAIFASILVARLASADVIELATGERVEGHFKQAVEGTVSIEIGGQTVTFGKEKVRAIYFGVAPAAMSSPGPASDAIKALKAVQSVTQGGIAYREYATRVNDAKIVVDRYLEAASPQNDSSKAAVAAAMGYYVLASSTWNASITQRVPDLPAVDVPFEECRQLLVALPPRNPADLQDANKRREYFLTILRGMPLMGNSLTAPLWSCASERIAEAEKQSVR